MAETRRRVKTGDSYAIEMIARRVNMHISEFSNNCALVPIMKYSHNCSFIIERYDLIGTDDLRVTLRAKHNMLCKIDDMPVDKTSMREYVF